MTNFAYDSLSRRTTETWYDNVTDADVPQNARKTYTVDEAEVAFELLGDRPLSPELDDGDVHRQFVPNRSEEFLGDHGYGLFDWGGRFIRNR